MMDTASTVPVKVELFGTPRLLIGAREVELQLPGQTSLRELVASLAAACPPLVGPALREDLTGLTEGYVLNHNGLVFLDEGELELRTGDFLLLLSSQAGG